MNLDVTLIDGSVVSFLDSSEQVRLDSSVKARLYRWHAFRVSPEGTLAVREKRIILDRFYGQGVVEETISTLRRFDVGKWVSLNVPRDPDEVLPTPAAIIEEGLRIARHVPSTRRRLR